jgi:acyl-CoA hydrolase
MVAVDKAGKPTAIPKLILKTDKEKKRNKEALERRKLRLKFS